MSQSPTDAAMELADELFLKEIERVEAQKVEAIADFDAQLVKLRKARVRVASTSGPSSISAPVFTVPSNEHESVRVQIARYVAHLGPVSPGDVISALGAQGANERTVRQSIYDLTSAKAGWLKRTDDGLVITTLGEEGMNSTRRRRRRS